MDKILEEKLINFANKHKVKLEKKGEVGFGRPCVGFISKGNYIAYNPVSIKNGKLIELVDKNGDALYDDRHYDLRPVDSYHKGDYVAVLVRFENYDKALIQLAQWVDNLEKEEVKIVEYDTLAEGLQADIIGKEGKALKFK